MQKSIKQKSIPRYVKLDDYKVFDYEIPETFLDFVIEKEKVKVKTKLKLKRRNKKAKDLILDGTEIFIKKIYINESLLNENDYTQIKHKLIIRNIKTQSKGIIECESLSSYFILIPMI